MFFGWAFFLISLGSPHVRPVGRTCGEPNEIELTPIGVKLNVWLSARHVLPFWYRETCGASGTHLLPHGGASY